MDLFRTALYIISIIIWFSTIVFCHMKYSEKITTIVSAVSLGILSIINISVALEGMFISNLIKTTGTFCIAIGTLYLMFFLFYFCPKMIKEYIDNKPYRTQTGKLILRCMECRNQVYDVLKNTFVSAIHDFDNPTVDGIVLDIAAVIYLYICQEIKELSRNRSISIKEFTSLFYISFSDYMTKEKLTYSIEYFRKALEEEYCSNHFSIFQDFYPKNKKSFRVIAAFADSIINPDVEKYLKGEIQSDDVNNKPLEKNETLFYSKVIRTKVYPLFNDLKESLFIYANNLDK